MIKIYFFIILFFLFSQTAAFSSIKTSSPMRSLISAQSALFLADNPKSHWALVKKARGTVKDSTEKSKAWINRSVLFDEWNFAKYVWNPHTVIAFYPNGKPALDHIIKKNTRLTIQKVTPTHIQVQIKKQKLWILRDLLKIDPSHLGDLVSKHKTPLREKPYDKSQITGYIKAGIRLTPISFQKNFVQIKWNKKNYFIPFHHTISRLNFAKKVKVGQDWKDILFSMGHFIKTTDGQFVSIDQVQGLQGRKSLAYNMASKAYIRDRPQGQVIQVIHQFTPLFIVNQKQIPHQRSQRTITTDQLFERKVFDVASARHLMLASANGIFKSFDGSLWERLTFFENKNFPLAISPSGKLYIGPYRSTDHGKTFHHYIRWDLVFNALKANDIHAVSELRIKDIEFLNNNDKMLQMTLHIGRDWSEKIKLSKVISYNEGLSWRPTK